MAWGPGVEGFSEERTPSTGESVDPSSRDEFKERGVEGTEFEDGLMKRAIVKGSKRNG